jgi:hypothetical protein
LPYCTQIAFGTDKVVRSACNDQARDLLKLKSWFTNAEILRMATGNGGEIVKMSGARDPYPKKLGVIEEACSHGAFGRLPAHGARSLAVVFVDSQCAAFICVLWRIGHFDALTLRDFRDNPLAPVWYLNLTLYKIRRCLVNRIKNF